MNLLRQLFSGEDRKLEPIAEHKRFDAPIEAPLRRKVAVGFTVAVLLTIFIGVSSWHGARRAEQDAYWVAHTHEVMETIQRTTRHVIEAETSARAFALTGQEPLLAHYQAARTGIYQDDDALRHLTADNLSQQRRLDALELQVRTALEFAESIIAKRRKLQAYPGGGDAVETERLIEVVRVTDRDMYAEETRLLGQRTQRAGAGQRLTKVIAALGVFVGLGLWVLAFLAVNHEIHISSRARAQLSTLNAELERRVEQRTAALHAEIAERKRAEEALREQAQIMNSAQVFVRDMQSRVVFWPEGAEKLYGFTRQEAVGILSHDLFHTKFPEPLEMVEKKLFETGMWEGELIHTRRDGRIIVVSSAWVLHRDRQGQPIRILETNVDITARKHAEQALHESEERFQAMANGIPQLAWMAEADGNIFWYNQRWYDYTGTTPEQMQGWGWQSVHDPDVLPKVLEGWKGAIAAGQPFEMEFPLRGANGKYGTFLTRIVPVKDAEGRVTRWFGTNTDISERKRTEERLAGQAEELSQRAAELTSSRQSLETQTLMLQSVLDSMGEGLIAADREGHFLIWNDAANKLMGREPADLPTEQWTPHYRVFLPDGITPYPPDRLPLVRALHGESVLVELMIERPENVSPVFLEIAARPLKDRQGNVGGGVAVLRDITERKRAEAALSDQAEELSRQTEELQRSQQALEAQQLMLRSVLDSMAEGLVAADEHGKFIISNPAAVKILGLGAANLPSGEWRAHYGLFLEDTVTPFPADQLPLVLAIRGEASTAQIFVRNPEIDQGVWIEANASPLKDKDGVVRGGVVAFRDITQRRTDEQEIRKLNEELEERVEKRTMQLEAANKELEAFTYSVSHDLRAPLRHMSGFTRILSEEFGPSLPVEAQNYLQRIEQGAGRMGRLVDELLNLARMGRQALRVQVTGLSAIVKDVVTMLEPETEGRQVVWKIAELPSLECDPILIRQVFQNLISNALKYSRPRCPAVIEIGQTEHDGQCAIFVRDNGVGFDMKYADKLFGVFQRLHRVEDFEGTGVGLATVQRIIHKHGGRIRAEAELDKGATFYFTLGAATAVAREAIGAAVGKES